MIVLGFEREEILALVAADLPLDDGPDAAGGNHWDACDIHEDFNDEFDY